MKQPEGTVTFILPKALSILAKGALAEKQDASRLLPPGGQPLSSADFCIFSTETERPLLYPEPPAFYFQFRTSSRAAGTSEHSVMTYRGIGLSDDADLIFDWYRGIGCTISTRQTADDDFLRSVPDVASHRDSLYVIGHYTLRFVLWYVNDIPCDPRTFWRDVENKQVSKNDVVDYCELGFVVNDNLVQEIEVVCNYATTVHLWPLGEQR